jgi:glycine dehydrogenase
MLTADTCYYLIQEKGSLPLEYVADNKFWPSVRRVDETYGDRNLICSCAPIEAYM